MPFTFKLSVRLALMKASLPLAAAAVLVACELPGRRVTDPAPPNNVVVQVVTSPDIVILDPYQERQFLAFGRTQAGDSVAVAVRWSAAGGTITAGGLYTADTIPGDFQVTAQATGSTAMGSSQVRNRGPLEQVILTPPTPSVAVGGSVQFAVYGRKRNGDSVAVSVSYSATGGSISAGGLYTAGPSAGAFRAIATQSGGTLADTATVAINNIPVASVTVSPAAASVMVGQSAQLTATPKDASGNPLSGRVVTWLSSNSALATVNGNGLVTGVAAGSATITAAIEGQTGAAAITVTAPISSNNPGTVTDLAVAGVTDSSATLSFTEVNDGTGQAASYAVRYAASPILWGPAADVARGTCATPIAGTVIGAKRVCTVLGLAPFTAYDFQLVAFRGTLNVNAVFGALSNVASGTTAGSTAPVASVTVSPATASVSVGQTVQLTATPKDANGNPLGGRVITWVSSNTGVATATANGLVAGVAAGAATITAKSEGQNGAAAITVTAAGGGGTVLFQEAFEDNAFASRGWYDNTSMTTTNVVHVGGARSLEAHFLAGATTPTWGGSARHLFQATPSVYVSYWVKYSDNWVGSGRPYHPHEFLVMSNLDGDFDGPSNGWLVAYIEHNYQNGGIPQLALQDNKSINTTYGTPPINLIGITENRSTAGCNGVVESNIAHECFNMPPWYNNKQLKAGTAAFAPTPGPGYKGNWNHVEAYFQLNAIAGGIGVADGVVQYWFNGALLIDRHDILFRTGARPNISFHQFLIAPYIGDGSPVDQYMWVDDLTVATSKP